MKKFKSVDELSAAKTVDTADAACVSGGRARLEAFPMGFTESMFLSREVLSAIRAARVSGALPRRWNLEDVEVSLR